MVAPKDGTNPDGSDSTPGMVLNKDGGISYVSPYNITQLELAPTRGGALASTSPDGAISEKTVKGPLLVKLDAGDLTPDQKKKASEQINYGNVIHAFPIRNSAGEIVSYNPLSQTQETDHRRRLANGVELKAEAGEYLLRNFGGMFSDARRGAMAANVSALRLEANVIRDLHASVQDMKMAQDYVNTTRQLMGKIGTNETMKDAIDMMYVRKSSAEKDKAAENELEIESYKKKRQKTKDKRQKTKDKRRRTKE
jgi:hypothetical protein